MSDPTISSPEVRLTRTPAPAPAAWFDIRADIAARVLSGSGIEIGGLHYPLAVPAGVTVRYVDRMSVPELREHYPELNHLELVEVDIVDEGERLETIRDASLDFIVANHFLEHCHDPIATVENHLRKLAPGGVLFYAVPDKRFTFDVDREVTKLEHIILDHEMGPERSRAQHFDEWARYVYEDPHEPVRTEEQIRELARELDLQDYSIHTHVFTQAELLQLILHCRERFENAFDIEVAWRRSLELIVVLRKAGSVAIPGGFVAPHSGGSALAEPTTAQAPAVIDTRVRAAVARLRSRADEALPWRPRLLRRARTADPRVSVPLSVLRRSLDVGLPDAAIWRPSVIIGGVRQSALELRSGSPASFRLRLRSDSWLSASVAFAPGEADSHAPRARFTVGLRSLGGGSLGSWTRTVVRDSQSWVDFRIRLLGSSAGDARDVDLFLTVSGVGEDGAPAPVRGAWGGLALEIPATAIPELPKAPIPSTRNARAHASISSPSVSDRPLVSVLMPVHDPDPAFLEAAIASVRGQTYANWQLCLADDGSTDGRIRTILDRHVSEDDRIELTRHEPAQGISAATNAALALARGDFIALVDHDDLIVDDALEALARLLDEDQTLDMVYSDEDRISADGTDHSATFFKPDWSPDLFRSAMYTCHLGAYRRSLVVELGGFRPEFDGSQDYDLVFRVMERTNRIGHIARVLYSWRIHGRSAASHFDAKPVAADAARRAIEAHLRRTGADGRVEFGSVPGCYRVRCATTRSRVALLVPLCAAPSSSEGSRALSACARSWLSGAPNQLEIVVAGPHDALSAYARLLSEMELNPAAVRFCTVENSRNAQALLSAAAAETDADFVLLLPEPLRAHGEDWLEQLVGLAGQSGVGIAGGVVRTGDGRVASGAVAFGDGWPLHVMYGHAGGAFPAPVANFLAADGPIMMRSRTFASLGGLEDELGDLACVDLCLRARQRDLRTALAAEVTFVRPTVAPEPREDPRIIVALRQRWCVGEDPYYNANFWRGNGEFIPLLA